MASTHQDSGLLPQAPELEAAVLGAMIVDSRVIDEAGPLLEPDAFYVVAHRTIFGAIVAMHEAGTPVDILTLTIELKKRGELDAVGGPVYISQLTNNVASSANVQTHTRIVLQQWARRRVIEVAALASKSAGDDGEDVFDVLDGLQSKLDTLNESLVKRQTITIRELLSENMGLVDEQKSNAQSTGWPSLDAATLGGYQPGDLVIVSARPGMGKTAFMISSQMNAAKAGYPSILFEAELTPDFLYRRYMSAETGIPLSSLVSRSITDRDIQLMHERYETMAGMPMYVNLNRRPSLRDLRSEIARHKRLYDIKAAYIDQINWMQLPDEKGGRSVGNYSALTRGLRSIAVDLEIPIIALHQQSRATSARGGDFRPQLTDLKHSGSFEEDAQLIMFLYRPEYYLIAEDSEGRSTKDRVDIIIAKQSNGALKDVPLRFHGPTASIHDDFMSSMGSSFNPRRGFTDDNPF